MASTEGQKCGGQTKMCAGRQWWQRRKRRWRRSEPRTAFPWLSKFSSNLNSRLSFGAEEVQNRTKARDRAEEALQDDKKDPRARARRGSRHSGPQQIWKEYDSRRYSIATEVPSNPNRRLNLSNLSKRVTSPNHRSGSDRLRGGRPTYELWRSTVLAVETHVTKGSDASEPWT